MIIKCVHCAVNYMLERGACPECGKTGGYVQEPSSKQLGTVNYHLEETLVHTKTGNEYPIKEIQAEGFITVLKKGLLNLVGKRAYISNTNLNEYKRS